MNRALQFDRRIAHNRVVPRGMPEVLNLPNSITLSRIGCVPIFIWVLSTNIFPHGVQEALAAAIFILASATDGLDGYLARKNGQISSVGMLLDPMADKLLVASGLILLVRYTPNLMPAWVVVIVLGREFLITGLRSVAATEGFALSAREVGKFKMVIQIVAIVATVLAHGWYEWNIFGFILGVELVSRMATWFMLAVTVISAVDYMHAFWGCLQRPVRTRDTAPNAPPSAASL